MRAILMKEVNHFENEFWIWLSMLYLLVMLFPAADAPFRVTYR